MRVPETNPAGMQLAFMFDHDTDIEATDRSRFERESRTNQPLRQSDKLLFKAIVEAAKMCGTRLLTADKEQWQIQLGHYDIIRITSRSRSSVRRLIRRLIDRGYVFHFRMLSMQAGNRYNQQ